MAEQTKVNWNDAVDRVREINQAMIHNSIPCDPVTSLALLQIAAGKWKTDFAVTKESFLSNCELIWDQVDVAGIAPGQLGREN